MKYLNRLLTVAAAAILIASSAFAQNAGTVTNHAFAIGQGAGTAGYHSLLCASLQLAVGQTGADPICTTGTADQVLRVAPAGASLGFGSIDLSKSAAVGASLLALANGGCNTALTASNGGILWSNASQCQILAGTATARLPLLSGATATPVWGAFTLPASVTSGGIPFFSSTSAEGSSALLTANAIMLGGGGGVAPSTLGSLGTTATVLHGNAAGAPSFGAIVNGDITANTIANGSLATMAANTTKANATGGIAAPTDVAPATARSSSLLNIDQFTGHGDSIYTILATDRTVGTNAAFTASRTWTLPAANAVNPGQEIIVADFQGTVTGVNTLVISRAGADTINGATTVTISTANGTYLFKSDGVSKWNAQNIGGAGGGGISNITPGNGIVSSTAAACSQTAITTSGTLSAAECVNAQTGTTYTFVDGDRAKLVTGTNAAAQAYTLPQAGATSSFVGGWFAYVENRGAGLLTITPTTSTIDGATALSLSQNQGVIVASDGTNYFTLRGGGTDYQTFTANGTWTKPSGLSGNERVFVQLWAGGGAGGASAGNDGGGGGGAYCEAKYRVSDLGATESVTVPAATVGGAGTGSAGGNAIFKGLTCFGGGGGGGAGGGGGGGWKAAGGSNGAAGGGPLGGAAGAPGGDSTFGGGGPGNAAPAAGGYSVYGGGGGSYTTGVGGSSVYAGGGGSGNGGTAGNSVFGGGGGATGGGAGTAPGGGGGANPSATGGTGARGEARIWVLR